MEKGSPVVKSMDNGRIGIGETDDEGNEVIRVSFGPDKIPVVIAWLDLELRRHNEREAQLYLTKDEFCDLFKRHGHVPDVAYKNRVGKLWSSLCKAALYSDDCPIVVLCPSCEQSIRKRCTKSRYDSTQHAINACGEFRINIGSLITSQRWFISQHFRGVGDQMVADLTDLIGWLSNSAETPPAP